MKNLCFAAFIVSLAALLSACGGGSGGGGSTGTQTGQYSVVTAVRYSAPASSCANGGISVDAGIDRNGNGVLDQSEVTSTQYVCNGANGLTTLVDTIDEPAGTNCTYGGSKVNVGLDGDSNGILDPSEITSSDYICNGTIGQDTDEPTISKTTPEVGGTGVPVKLAISVTFSEPMDPSTINAETFTLNGDSPVTGTVTYSGLTATFTPSAPLSYSALYAARITTGAKDLAGNPVIADFTWTFMTGTPGMFDMTFNSTGIATTSFGAGDSFASSVAIQSDGKIIAAGRASSGAGSDFGLARYNVDGSPDTTFNTRGIVTTDIDTYDILNSIAIQSDGKVVAAGFSSNGTDSNFALARYNSDGTLDVAFGTGGIVTTSFGTGTSAFARGVAIQSGGKIVVAGYSSNGGTEEFALARYNFDGTLDTTFNSTGIVTTPIGTLAGASGIAIQPDGRVIAAGYSFDGSNYNFAVVRYKTDGMLDSSFNSTGIVTTPIMSPGSASSIALQPDGKIVVAGSNSFGGSFIVARYKTDGTLDTTFNSTGIVTTFLGWTTVYANSMAIQSDGRIVVAGSSGGFFSLTRYNTSGALDTSFGMSGIVQTGDIMAAYGVAIQPDDRIVIAGNSATYKYSFSGNNVFTIARFIP